MTSGRIQRFPTRRRSAKTAERRRPPLPLETPPAVSLSFLKFFYDGVATDAYDCDLHCGEVISRVQEKRFLLRESAAPLSDPNKDPTSCRNAANSLECLQEISSTHAVHRGVKTGWLIRDFAFHMREAVDTNICGKDEINSFLLGMCKSGLKDFPVHGGAAPPH